MAKSYGMTSAGTGAEVRLWSSLVASVAVTIAVSSLTGDPLLRRSFRATPLPASAQARPCVVGLSVLANDCCSEHVLARIWHESIAALSAWESRRITPPAPDLAAGVSVPDRHRPLVTDANGP